MAVLTRPILRRLPEPEDADGKPRYADLATPRLVAGCAVSAGVAVTVGWVTAPPAIQPLWWVLSASGFCSPPSTPAPPGCRSGSPRRPGWPWRSALLLAAARWVRGRPTVLRTVAGAALAGLPLPGGLAGARGGFGFGDVRFAPLVGAATAAPLCHLLIWALLLGSLLGAVYGMVRLARRRTGPVSVCAGDAGRRLPGLRDGWAG